MTGKWSFWPFKTPFWSGHNPLTGRIQTDDLWPLFSLSFVEDVINNALNKAFQFPFVTFVGQQELISFIKTCRLYLVVIATQLIPSTLIDVPNAQIRKYSTCPILPIIVYLKVKSLKDVFSLERWRYVKGFQRFHGSENVEPVTLCSSPFPWQVGTSEEISTEILPRGQEHSLTFSSLFVKVPAFAQVEDGGGGGGDLHWLLHYVWDCVCPGRCDCLFYCPLVGSAGD